MNNAPNNVCLNDPLSSDKEIDFWGVWEILDSGKWWILGISLLFCVGGGVYSFTLPPIYQAKIVLAPAQQSQVPGSSALLAQLAPIASLAGLSTSPQLGVATIQSAQFAEDFITRNNLMPVLFQEQWDGVANRWRGNELGEIPDIRDGVRVFREDVVRISSDVKTGLLTISVDWKNPAIAAAWANELATFANDALRDRALATAERNLAYLKTELPATTSVTVQQSIGRLLDQEMQAVMLARGNPEYAFRVIDPAKPPKFRSSPKRAQITIMSTIIGALLGILFVFSRRAIRSRGESFATPAASNA